MEETSIKEYLTSQKEQAPPELAKDFDNFLDLWSRKLWYQLSVALVDFVKNPPTSSTFFLSDFYTKFAAHAGKFMKPLSFVRIAIACNKGKDFTTLQTFLEELPFNNKLDTESDLHVQIERAHVYVTCRDPKVKGKEECLKLLKKSQATLQANPEMDDLVHANYYRVLLQYDKIMGNHTSYYTQAFKYMTHAEYSEISQEEKIILAKDLAIAGLASGDIFCLDELLGNQLWKDVLPADGMGFFNDILVAVNTGNITAFRKACEGNALPKSLAVPEARKVLEQKIRVTALMDLVFNLSLDERTVSFTTVSNRCELVKTEVEAMVMHALSKNLVGGIIDQVKEVIHFTHVKPRNLGLERISNMKDKASAWLRKIEAMETVLTTSPETLVAA